MVTVTSGCGTAPRKYSLAYMSFLRHAIHRHEKVIQLLAYSLYILTNLTQQNYNVAVRNFDETLQLRKTNHSFLSLHRK